LIKTLSENRRYFFKFYYTGSENFYGSQRQKNLLTIEGCLINILKETNYIKSTKSSKIEFASRTDKFVSARGAVFSFNTEKDPILMEINRSLPKEIGVWAYAEVPNDFSSRFNADYRHYRYIVPQPLSYLKMMRFIDLEIMKDACKELEGKHDFKNFSKFGKEDVKTIRDMDSVRIRVINDYIIFDIKSRAFLRQQVRRMVKKVLEVGTKEISIEDFLELFDSSKSFSYQPVEPEGLVLWDIKYDDSIEFKTDPKSVKRMLKYFKIQEQKHALKHYLFDILQHDNLG